MPGSLFDRAPATPRQRLPRVIALIVTLVLLATACDLTNSEAVVDRVATASETVSPSPVGEPAPANSSDEPRPAATSGDAALPPAETPAGPTGPDGDGETADAAADDPDPIPDDPEPVDTPGSGLDCAERFDDEIPGLRPAPIRRDLANCNLDACEVVAGGRVCFFTEDDDDRRADFLSSARPGAVDALSTYADWSLPIGEVHVLLSDNSRIFGETSSSAEALAYGSGPGQPCQVVVFNFDDAAELTFTLAHELFHCIGYWGHVGADYDNQVLWASEAGPEWAAVSVTGSASQAHAPVALNAGWAHDNDIAYGTWPFWAWVADARGPAGVIEVVEDFGSNLAEARDQWRSLEAGGGLAFHDFVERSIEGSIPLVPAASVTHTNDAPVTNADPFEVERREAMPFAGWHVDVTIAESGRYRFGEATADASVTVRHGGSWHANGYEFDVCESGAVTIAVSSIADEASLDFGVDHIGEAAGCGDEALADVEPADPDPEPATQCVDGVYVAEEGSLIAAYSALLGDTGLGANFETAVVTPSGGTLSITVAGPQASVLFEAFTLDMRITVPGSDPFQATATVNGGGTGPISPTELQIGGGSVSVQVTLASEVGPITEGMTLPISGSWPISCDGVAITVGDAIAGSQQAVFLVR